MSTALPPWPHPRWIAHRGAGKLAPENTLAAFRLGAAHGYRAFECDVKLSADDVPFLLHDTTLDRTTPECGRAADRPWSELSRLDAGSWHSPAYAGEPLASLQSIATWLQANGHWLDLEIKPTEGDEERTGRLVAGEVERLWVGCAGAPPLLSSFRPEALVGARHAAPKLARALLVDTHWPHWMTVAQDLGCVAVITHYNLMDASLIQHLHTAGLRALCYTVNDLALAQQLLAMGIDGLITDAVDQFPPGAV
jgi:glycerophosphoryl diester phosphodiesterase